MSPSDKRSPDQAAPGVPPRQLTPAAKRALAEAAERRRKRQQDNNNAPRDKEIGGREGPDPVRYGDWENNGIISDF